MIGRRVAAPMLAVALVGAGCSSPPPAAPTDTIVTSNSGALRLDLRIAPDQGSNTAELRVTNVDGGAPATGLTIAIVPWMPAMNHGSIAPTVTSDGPGSFQVTELDLPMAGHWDLQVTLTGSTNDHATVGVQVP